MAVPGRNQTLFRCAFRSYYHIRSTVTQYFRYRWDSYLLCKIMNTWNVYTVHMSLTPRGSSALKRFECCNANEMSSGIMFDFYPGLPHMVLIIWFSGFMPFCVTNSNRMENAKEMLRMKLISLLLFRLHDQKLSHKTIKAICNVLSALLGSSPGSEDVRRWERD